MWSSRVETNFRRMRTKRMSAYEAPFDLAASRATSASSFIPSPPGVFCEYTGGRAKSYPGSHGSRGSRLFAARELADQVPLLGGDALEVVELAGAAQPLAAVDDDAFAVDVGDAVRDEEDGQVGQLVVVADAAHRDALE